MFVFYMTCYAFNCRINTSPTSNKNEPHKKKRFVNVVVVVVVFVVFNVVVQTKIVFDFIY